MSEAGSSFDHSHSYSEYSDSHSLSSFDQQLHKGGSQSWTGDSLARTSFSRRKHVHSVERNIVPVKQPEQPREVAWTPLVWKFVTQLALTTAFFAVELVVGIWINSLALQADAYHMLGDSLALLIGLYSALNENRPEDTRYTFGYSRWETVGSLINTSILLFICFDLSLEAVTRCFELEDFKDSLARHVDKLFIVGSLGLLLNVIGIFVFSETHERAHGHAHDHGHDHGHGHGHGHGRQRSKILKKTLAGSAQHYVPVEQEIDDVEAFDADELIQFQQRVASHGDHNHKHSHKHDHNHTHGHDHDHDHNHDHGHAHSRTEMYSVYTNSGMTTPLVRPKERHRTSHAVYLHVLGDALGSLAVIVSAIVIKYWKQLGDARFLVDPVCTVVIAVFILISTWPLFWQNVNVLLQGVPAHVDIEAIRKQLQAIEGVKGIHNLHIWELNARRYVAAVHIVVHKNWELSAITETKLILHEHSVHNTTVQAEYGEPTACWEPICDDENCMTEKMSIIASSRS